MKVRAGFVVLAGLFFCLSLAAGARAEEVDLLAQGISEYTAENYEEALAAFTQAQAAGEDGNVSYYLGVTYKRMGDNRTALRHFDDAKRLGTTESGLYREIADCYLALDDFDAARKALNDGQAAGAPKGELAYTRGLLLSREKDYDGALAAFDEAGKAEPSLAGMAQFQTAMVLAAQKKPQQARAVLQALISADRSAEVTAYARDYERQFTAALEQHRSWRATVQAAYMYDSNAIGAPELSTPATANLPDEKDHALIANLRVDYQPLLEGNFLFSGRYTINTVSYADNTTSNQITQNLTLTPGLGNTSGALTLPLFYSHSFLDSDQYQQIYGLRPTLSLRVGKGHVAQLLGGYSKREMLFDYANAATEATENRDSDILMAGAGYIYLYAGGRGMINLRYELVEDDAEGTNWRNTGNRFAGSALIPLSSTLSANIGGEVFLQGYEGTNSFFGVARRDETYNASAGLGWELTSMAKLTLQYNFTRDDSNIYIYDYVRHAVTAGVELNF